MPKKKIRTPEKLFEALDLVRARLGENPRDDHLAEIKHWEDSVRTAAIRLSIEKNEGIAELIKRAREEIVMINEALLSDSNRITFTASTTADLANREIARQELLSMKKLWLWFLSFFTENRDELAQADKFVEEQLIDQEEEDELQ